jgi:glycosyltransferase involved in cell wall biosynthesis
VLVDGETGLLVEPRDPVVMAARLVDLLTNEPLCARIAGAALARAREHFSVMRMVEGTAAVYEALVA